LATPSGLMIESVRSIESPKNELSAVGF
jgi:hypothetical protein